MQSRAWQGRVRSNSLIESRLAVVDGRRLMIQNVLVLGAGSAGLLAAITLKKKLPRLTVRLVRSSDIGVIGVGEGTTPAMPRHLFGFLGLSQARFYAQAEPTWKLGIRFDWGPRPYFDYTFAHQLDGQWSSLARPNGFYADEEFRGACLATALMEAGKAFPRNPRAGGGPDMSVPFGFHIENVKLVETLEKIAAELGVTFVEGKVSGTERGSEGLATLRLEDGQRLEADFFVDCSGFRSELLGGALAEPFVSYDRALFCDRAVIGGWERTTEPIEAYTLAETMDAGWAWQIEHEHHINRGYVYSSQAISDEEACDEFLRKNPKAPRSPRVVKFRSGRYRRMWVDNVVAIGNSAGFVEPLEATALMAVSQQCEHLVTLLEHGALRQTPTLRQLLQPSRLRGFRRHPRLSRAPLQAKHPAREQFLASLPGGHGHGCARSAARFLSGEWPDRHGPLHPALAGEQLRHRRISRDARRQSGSL